MYFNLLMNYGEIKKNDIANGEGVRTSLFVSGCRHHCKSCFNQQTWDFGFGEPFTEKTMEEIFDACKYDWINGLSLLGGEPFEPENQKVLLPFLIMFKERFPNKDIWCYSGFTLEEILGKKESRAFTPISAEMLGLIDILVDGRFEEDKKDISLVFRGSSNQRIIDVKKTLEGNEIALHIE
ncbi:MAG: anaerobic ribonucleoside-triphosphate reductase activating protein [Eubacterium sp.]